MVLRVRTTRAPRATGLAAVACAASAIVVSATTFAAPAAARADVSGDRGATVVINSADSAVRAEALGNPRRSSAYIVFRPVVEPAAVVSRALHEQPVYPHLIELHRAGVTTYIDPTVNYHLTGGPGHMDQNNLILQAQRLFNARHARSARVVRNMRGVDPATMRAEAVHPQPIFRLEVPRPADDAPAPKVAMAENG